MARAAHASYRFAARAFAHLLKSGDFICATPRRRSCTAGKNNLVNVFIHAPEAYRLEQVMKTYGDTKKQGKKNIKSLDAARAAY